jgi:hypothetical protein
MKADFGVLLQRQRAFGEGRPNDVLDTVHVLPKTTYPLNAMIW